MAKAKKITDEKILAFVEKENWIDYQAVFTKRYELTRQLSLEEALGRAEIEPEGRFHDGLDDAVNTGYLIEKLELNPDYQLVMRCRKSRQNIFRVILENCLQSLIYNWSSMDRLRRLQKLKTVYFSISFV